jgi:hypothetical protein
LRVRRAGSRRWWLLAFVLLSGLGGPFAAALAQEGCLKQVFNRYCLGADVTPLMQQQPAVTQNDGDRVALIFYNGPDRDYVMAFRGRIYKVLRQYRTTTQLRFDELYGLLRDKYGAGSDRSRFPGYATTPGRKQSAIRRGEGLAKHRWEPGGGWHIELSWTRELGLSLAYIADELDRQQQAELEGGY